MNEEHTCSHFTIELIKKLIESEYWTGWSNCEPDNHACDEPGVQIRRRVCSDEACVGPSIEARRCNLTRSAVDQCKSSASDRIG